MNPRCPAAKREKFRYLSFGAGVQSSALLLLSDLRQRGVPRADVAIFADTGDEPKWVYEQVDRMKDRVSIPIHTVSAGVLSQDLIDRHAGRKTRFVCIPAFTESTDGAGEAQLRRQCTREYKIAPIERHVRQMLGYGKGQRMRHRVEALIGISMEEIGRMRPSRTSWITNLHPLIDAGIYRSECIKIVMDAGLPLPRKSACVFCPYHSDAYWRDLRVNYPEEFERAAKFDEAIRDMTASGLKRPAFLHRTLVPLRVAVFKDEEQLNFDFQAECEGMCGL